MLARLQIAVTGVVQGVGFRPFVYGLARGLGLTGTVGNEAGFVWIDVEGESVVLELFLKRLGTEAPPLAKLEQVRAVRLPGRADFDREKSFVILQSNAQCSTRQTAGSVFISPDIATCEDCLKELLDPNDRRFEYPFTNCVNCGPRMTIIRDVPYDRERTTMRDFELCDACRAEYDDPSNRRFHAQPVACASCGPWLELKDRFLKRIESPAVINRVAGLLREGAVVAIKGLGGYHLACDARDSAAVNRLRAGKQRNEKPLAVMVHDIEQVRSFAEVSREEADLLLSLERPIVLLKKNSSSEIAEEVSVGSPDLGVMLPYTPLHHLLLRAMNLGAKPGALVMTSGNASDRPIVYRDEELHGFQEQLGGIADYFLTHNRPIQMRCDDSVVRTDQTNRQTIRRSRGFAPGGIPLPKRSEVTCLAVGAQLKNTFALASEHHAIVSHHIGDLDDVFSFDAFKRDIGEYERLFSIRPELIVHDLHPDYHSTRYAFERAEREGLKRMAVQHHHAHMASCMAENRVTEDVIGVTFDGTGFGTDGRIWGGEFLVGGYRNFVRAAHLKYVPMPSGEQAIREPWRMAFSHLRAAGIEPENIFGKKSRTKTFMVLDHLMSRELNAPLTSSMGRLFDAIAAILLPRHREMHRKIGYEGQAATELEWLAALAFSAPGPESELAALYPFSLNSGPMFPMFIDAAPVVTAVVRDFLHSVPGPVIARRFHLSVAELIREVCFKIREDTGLNRVALSGGVFMNALLLRETISRLESQDFEVYRHHKVPTNDGGISLGQIAIAAQEARQEM